MEPIFQRFGDVTIQRLEKPKGPPLSSASTIKKSDSTPSDDDSNDDQSTNLKRSYSDQQLSIKKFKLNSDNVTLTETKKFSDQEHFSETEISDYDSDIETESDSEYLNNTNEKQKFEDESNSFVDNFTNESLLNNQIKTDVSSIKSSTDISTTDQENYDFDIKEKLKEMGEISFQTVKKGEKPKKMEVSTENEVVVTPARKPGSNEDDSGTERKGLNLRRNIREVMDETKLDESTLAAQRQEAERLQRVQEQQRLLREIQRQAAQDRAQHKVMSLLQGNALKPGTSSTPTRIGNTVLVKLPNGQTKPMTRLPKRPFDLVRIQKNSGPSPVSVATSTPRSSKMMQMKKSGTNLTPSVSIAPVTKKILTPPIKTRSESESEDETIKLSPEIKKEEPMVQTIDVSSDEDCIVVSDTEGDNDDTEDDPSNSGMHTNDEFNLPDNQGRVLVNVGHPDNEDDIFLASQIARIIKPHQIGGVRFLYDNVIESTTRFESSAGFGCILAHSMGLGKTLQVISFCDIFFRYTPSKTILCIMPINTLQNWMAEFNMWLPSEENIAQSPLNLHGEVRSRNFNLHVLNDSHKTLNARSKVIHAWRNGGGVLLIGYEQFRLLSLKKHPKTRRKSSALIERVDEDKNKILFDEIHEALVKPGPDLVICDEGHRIKNSHASISQALKQMKTKRRIVLTGYPLQNNLMEYWCMVDFVRPNYLGSKTEFCNMFERPIMNGQCIDSTESDIKLMRYRAHVLHSLLVGFVQRRSHAVLQTTLPQKEEYVLLVRMLPFQRKLYETFMDEVVRSQAVPNPLKAFAVCCKIWNHPDVLYNFLKKRARGDAVDIDLEEVASTTGTTNESNNKQKRTPAKSRSKAGKGKNNKPAASITPYNSSVEPELPLNSTGFSGNMQKYIRSPQQRFQKQPTSATGVAPQSSLLINQHSHQQQEQQNQQATLHNDFSNFSQNFQQNFFENRQYNHHQNFSNQSNTSTNNFSHTKLTDTQQNFNNFNQNFTNYSQDSNFSNNSNSNYNKNNGFINNISDNSQFQSVQSNYNNQQQIPGQYNFDQHNYQHNNYFNNSYQNNYFNNNQHFNATNFQISNIHQHQSVPTTSASAPPSSWLVKNEEKPQIKNENSCDSKPKINIISNIKIPNTVINSPEKKINIISDIKLEPKKEEIDDKNDIKPLIKDEIKEEDDIKAENPVKVSSGKDMKEDTGIPYDWAIELLKDYVPGCIENSAKMEVLFCIIRESIALGDRLLVFSQSLITLDLIEQFLQMNQVPGDVQNWARNTSYYRLDGSTSALEREKLINEFNSNPKIHLFLVSTRAGSLGINLIGANRVVVLDASWNPCHDTQAVCRVYRYGQQKPCFVYRLVVDNCLEKKIYDRQINKQGMSDRVVDECNPDAHLTMKDVSTLCWDDKTDEGEEKDWSHVKENYIDFVLQKVIENHGKRLNKEPFQHESLLVDRKEKQLSQQEKRLAKKGYEREKQAARQPSYNFLSGGRSHQRPIASVRPMQQGTDRPTRWIPAEHWKRQGMTAQEMILPLDVVIPTNQPEKGNIVLKAGQKVLVLKSPKGVYMQLESGKIVAIKTAIKVKGKAEDNESMKFSPKQAAPLTGKPNSNVIQKKIVKPFVPGVAKMNVKSIRQPVPNLVARMQSFSKSPALQQTSQQHIVKNQSFSMDSGKNMPKDQLDNLCQNIIDSSTDDEDESNIPNRSGEDDDKFRKQTTDKHKDQSKQQDDNQVVTALQRLEETASSVMNDNTPFQETLDSITNSYKEDSFDGDPSNDHSKPLQEQSDGSDQSDDVTYVSEQPPPQQFSQIKNEAVTQDYYNYYNYNMPPYPSIPPPQAQLPPPNGAPPPPPPPHPPPAYTYPHPPPPYDVMSGYTQQPQITPQPTPPPPPPPHPHPHQYNYSYQTYPPPHYSVAPPHQPGYEYNVQPPPVQSLYSGYNHPYPPQQYPPPPPHQGVYPPPPPPPPPPTTPSSQTNYTDYHFTANPIAPPYYSNT